MSWKIKYFSALPELANNLRHGIVLKVILPTENEYHEQIKTTVDIHVV